MRAGLPAQPLDTAVPAPPGVLRLFIDHAPAALAMFDRDMRYIAASRRWLADYRLDDVVGRLHYDVSPELPEKWRQVHRRCLAGAVERSDEDRLERADGTTQWLRWEVQPWYDAAGAVGGIVIFTEDITQRVLDRLELAKSEERFRTTFEQAAVGLAHIDPQGAWLRVNRKLCDILGYGHDELLARNFHGITFVEDRGVEAVQQNRLLAGEIRQYGMPVRFQRKDGGLIWVMLTMALHRGGDGAPDYLIAVVEDIDERKRSEQTVRELRGEMEQLLALHVAAQTAMAVAHELNQPLNALAAYTEAALRLLKAGNPRPERLVHAIEGAAAQAQRAGRVVRELISFLHQGRAHTQPLDLNEVVRESLAVAEASGYGGFTSRLELAPGMRPVLANRIQLEKVLFNLVRNGVEAMRAAGVAVKEIVITVSTAPDEDMAVVTVSDSGPGIEATAAERIFDPFFTTKPKGIGMGLAVSRALIESNGGRLWLEERTGAPGATFHFTLPFAPSV